MDTGNVERVQLFKTNYEKLAGKVFLTNSLSQAIQSLQQIFVECKANKVITTPFFKDISLQPAEILTESNFPQISFMSSDAASPAQINEADVGISAANFGIAFTGTIVEVTTEDSHRLISSLPRVHVALLAPSKIVHLLDEAAPQLRTIYQKNSKNCNITFISGPSRTADIEMKLFLGVHGPQKSYVIVCDF